MRHRKLLCISVTDNGIGIPADKLDIIFHAFKQADGSTHRKYGGTGLGLSISKELTSLLGGELIVDSEEGKGSCFSVYLPLDGKPASISTTKEIDHVEIQPIHVKEETTESPIQD